MCHVFSTVLTVAFEPCRSADSDADQTDRIVSNILADYFGGFAYVEQSSSVVASDCAFTNVRALFDGGHAG